MIVTSPVPAVDVPDIPFHDFVLHHGDGLGPRPAYVDGPGGRTVTYGELGPLSRRVAAGLAAHDFAPGDVLAILAPNVPEWPVAMLGALAAGGSVTGINPLWTVDEIAHQLADSGARHLLTVVPFLDLARAAAAQAGVTHLIVLGDAAGAAIPFGALLGHGGTPPAVRIDPATHIALLPYSSGTTGLSKGVRLTHRSLVANIAQTEPLCAMSVGDTVLGALPFFHVAGVFSAIGLALHGGATVVTLPRFDLDQALALIERHRVTALPAAPPVVLALATHPLVDRYDLSSLEMVMCGSAPLPVELEAAAAARLGRPVRQVYGLTEAATVVSISPRDGSAAHTPGSVGTLVAGTQARLTDPATGAEVGAGQPGELWIRGPQVMAGYLNRPDATAATIDPDGWLRTGDLGRVDADGQVFLVDRVKELIKVKGFQVPPAELEALLLTHPSVADAAVVPRPDEESGEVPVAFIVPVGEVDTDELAGWVAARVAHYKHLAAVTVVDEIPRSPAGKVLRRVLAERLRTPAI